MAIINVTRLRQRNEFEIVLSSPAQCLMFHHTDCPITRVSRTADRGRRLRPTSANHGSPGRGESTLQQYTEAVTPPTL